MIFEIFPEEYIQLNKEICSGFHPKLEEILAPYPANELDIKLAQCAAYTEIALNDFYTIEERRKLCDIIRERLVKMRKDPTRIITIQ